MICTFYRRKETMMPLNLALLRHGHSEGNEATHASRRGDDSFYTEEFRKRLPANWRLTEEGRRQAKISGAWIREHLGITFDRFITSEYTRAVETALHLGLPGPWEMEFFLRERDWNNIGMKPFAESVQEYGDFRRAMKEDPLHHRFQGGESIADTCLRTYPITQRLHRECSDKNVIMVCHGEVIDSYRIRLEHLTAEQYAKSIKDNDPRYDIKNGQVVHYTRIDPFTGEEVEKYYWVRSVCPWDLSLTDSSWQKIERKKYSNEDLEQIIARYPQIIP